jgi:endonuclease/exonuclease/phosphatase family metal-dependent hydrolase
MPTATVDLDQPPQDVLDALAVLGHGLDEAIPARRADNLLVGTWNIRAFGGATPRFEPGPKDNPKRNYADVCALAEVVRRFDVVAIQETREDLTALKAMMRRLGDHWTFIITDVGLGDAANGERLAYVYDRGRVKTSGLAGELVVPAKGIGEGDQTLVDQFARSPFAVSFSTGDDGLTLVTTHIVYGHQAKDRTKEIHAVGEWLKDRASSGRDFDTNMIALGDFNIDKLGDDNFEALTATGISIPDQLQTRSSTIFDHGTTTHFYDQIAWFESDGPEKLAFDCSDAGYFDWTKYILTDLESIPKSWRISDHFPLWCEFQLPGGSDLPGRGRPRRFA